jgi:uncharacterized protein YndB with AHSA1/START domain
MSNDDFVTSFTVDAPPSAVFDAVRNVRGWWSVDVTGNTGSEGDNFVFEVPEVHKSDITLTEVVPNERVVWHVNKNFMSFVEDHTEWTGSDIVFDIQQEDGKSTLTFTHRGLRKGECIDVCADAWSTFIVGSLKNLVLTGTGNPIGRDDDNQRLVDKALKIQGAKH